MDCQFRRANNRIGTGGYRLMLVELKTPLKKGDKIPVTLKFEKAGTSTSRSMSGTSVRPARLQARWITAGRHGSQDAQLQNPSRETQGTDPVAANDHRRVQKCEIAALVGAEYFLGIEARVTAAPASCTEFFDAALRRSSSLSSTKKIQRVTVLDRKSDAVACLYKTERSSGCAVRRHMQDDRTERGAAHPRI